MINKNMDKNKEPLKAKPEKRESDDFATGYAIDRVVIKDRDTGKELLNRRG